MTQVDDFWNIKKTDQTHNFRKATKYLTEGKCYTPERIIFHYNEYEYSVDFVMYINFKKKPNSYMYKGIGETSIYDMDIFRIAVYERKNHNVVYVVRYGDQQIKPADLADMNNPISKAVRASKYAIEHLFKL